MQVAERLRARRLRDPTNEPKMDRFAHLMSEKPERYESRWAWLLMRDREMSSNVPMEDDPCRNQTIDGV